MPPCIPTLHRLSSRSDDATARGPPSPLTSSVPGLPSPTSPSPSATDTARHPAADASQPSSHRCRQDSRRRRVPALPPLTPPGLPPPTRPSPPTTGDARPPSADASHPSCHRCRQASRRRRVPAGMEGSSDSYDSSTDDSDSPFDSKTEVTEQETKSQEHQSKEKRACKPRKPNELTNDTFKITRIDGRGVCVSPVKHAKDFNIVVGCIFGETIKITCTDIKAKDKENLREMLFNRLFNWYIFENAEMQKKVRHKALGTRPKP